MSGDNPVQRLSTGVHNTIGRWNAGGVAGAALGGFGYLGILGAKAGSDYYDSMTQKPADPLAPPAPPTLGDASRHQIGLEISHEQRMAASNTIMNGGQGLLDEPQTASQVLLGS